ncbi:MAG: tripartite tricarboxylate transporter TctB family protein [Eubacteriaceae bacterium]
MNKIFDKTSIVLIAIFIVATIFFWLSFHIPVLDHAIPMYKNRIDAGVFPKVLTGLIMVLSIIVIYLDYKTAKSGKLKKNDIVFFKDSETRNRIIANFVLVFLSAIFFNVLGAFLTIFFFVLIYLWIWGIRKLSLLLLTPLFVDLGIYVIFYRLLSVRLPKGILENIL